MLFIISLLIFSSCNKQDNNSKKTSILMQSRKGNYDSVLGEFANNYKPIGINLGRSLPKKLDSFLISTDTACLRKQDGYRKFIATILGKQFYYHLTYGHQGYDLQSMDSSGAGIIVNDFKWMRGYDNTHLEMLNSGDVMNFIIKDPKLKLELAPLVKLVNEKVYDLQKRHNNHTLVNDN
jgi:hypothetical protein